MYLKSIEIQGFKSFANRIVFEFQDGITGIVGPNGSGKSNVADAVRWVLGEQSAKQLRGSRMEDVIFSGTQLRKPQGFAYVEIVFDNTDHTLPIDFDEVKVARRVYRSGESEYLLNGAACRLRDVQEMFFDTGIGKEGYSIIGQGQIEKILSGKPEERRELFDEAAGIVKYKKRKNAAEKQLEEEKMNFERISDILTEIEKQLLPLERQQSTAREYLSFKEKLKVLEVNAFLLEQEKQEAAEQALEEKITLVEGDLTDAAAEFESSKEEYERFVGESEELSARIEENRTRKSEIALACQQKENEIKLITEQISSIRASEMHYKERSSVVKREQEERKQELTRYQSELAEIERSQFELEDAKSDAEQELEEIRERIAGYENEIENRNDDVRAYLADNSRIKADKSNTASLLEQNRTKRSALTGQVLQSESEDKEAKNALLQKKKRVSDIAASIVATEQELKLSTSKLVEVREAYQRVQESFEQTQREYIREQSRAESLSNLAERYDGYGNGIKRVMEQREREPGILGVVADVFSVDRKYETAIETALGGSIQNIVTDNEDTAKRMIALLKQDRAGRATFLPLSAVNGKAPIEERSILSEAGVIGYGSSLVKTEQRYLPVIYFLLGRTIVVDQIQNALSLARKYKYSLRIVTLDGEQLNPGGSMSGGAYKNASNLLGRRREVEEVLASVQKLAKRLDELAAKRDETRRERETLSAHITEAKEQLQDQHLKQNTWKLELLQAEEKEKANVSSHGEVQRELHETELQEKELTERLASMEEQLKSLEEQSRHNEECIEECNHKLSEERRKEHYAVEKCESIRIELGVVVQKYRFASENYARIEAELKKLSDEESRLLSEDQNAEVMVNDKQREINETARAIEKLKLTAEELETAHGELISNREVTTKKHKGILQKRDALSERKNELDKELFRLTEKRDKVKEQTEALNTYMWEEYELTYSEALKLRSEEVLNLQASRRQIAELKNKIKALGPVNVNSIEEYKECFERHSFLSAQREDLLTARENLMQMISELDEKMRKQFTEKFEEIKQQFDVVFSELFGGGKGTLELAEEEDILTAGIRINAQPPGKKLQNMMQLSGGEKALTAICLLFAIQNLKPSPFCLLDEIEAALDDSNVKRYANYLHKLTKHTQFIVITHRRGTMASANVLYGITMQEKGISTLVSVSLIEDKLDA